MSNIDKRALREAAEKHGDDDILALLDELEAKDKRLNEILTPNMLLPVIDDMDEDNLRHVIKTVCENYSLLHAKWEAAEKRIAELEAREAKLPKPISVLHRRDFMDAHRSIYAYPEEEVNAALADAGINIAAAGKGE